MTRTIRLGFGEGPDPDPAYQWDTKRKVFSLAEVCTPPSVIVVTCVFMFELSNLGFKLDPNTN